MNPAEPDWIDDLVLCYLLIQSLFHHPGNRDCMLMLEILSENRDLSALIEEEESMLSAIKLEDLPSYEIGIEKGMEKGIEKNQIKMELVDLL